MANVNVRIDENVKKEAESILRKIGLTPSTAINLFYVQIIETKSIPFDLALHEPNDETIAAIQEGRQLAKTEKGYKDIKSLKKALDI